MEDRSHQCFIIHVLLWPYETGSGLPHILQASFLFLPLAISTFFGGETRAAPLLSLRPLAVLRSLGIPLWLCPGPACSLYSCGSPWAGSKGTWCLDSNLESHTVQPVFVCSPKHAEGQTGQLGHPLYPDTSLPDMEQKRNKSQACVGPVGPPASLLQHWADSGRGRVYLRALTTFSCPVPLWRQRLPKKTQDATDEKRQRNQPGARGLGQETEQ